MPGSSYPLTSVIMSCYNAEQYLREAIESVLDQSFSDFEFILIDDGSTDATLEIIRTYERQDERIVVVEKENTGLAHSLNVGIGLARGKWIARLDADDLAMPQRFEEQINFLENRRGVVLLGSDCFEIDKFGREIKVHRYPITHRRFIRSIERGKSPFPHSSVMYKTETVRKVGGYRIRMNGAEDVDLWLRLSEKGKIHCLNKPLIKLRKHNASITFINHKKTVILSYAARTSHWIRKFGYSDPIDQEEPLFRSYLHWIEDELFSSRYFDELEFLNSIRRRNDGRNKSLPVLARLLISRHIFSIFRKRIWGTSLPKQLAKKWIDLNFHV